MRKNETQQGGELSTIRSDIMSSIFFLDCSLNSPSKDLKIRSEGGSLSRMMLPRGEEIRLILSLGLWGSILLASWGAMGKEREISSASVLWRLSSSATVVYEEPEPRVAVPLEAEPSIGC